MIDYAGVVERTNLLDLVQQAGANMRRAGKEWRGKCPLHSGDNPTAFSVYEDAGHARWKCWTHDCGQGDALDFVMKWLGVGKDEAYQYLGGDKGIGPKEIARLAVERAERVEKALQDTIAEANRALDELRRAHKWVEYHAFLDRSDDARQIWRARGVPDVWQDLWQLGYCPDFAYKSEGELYHSPTISIPIFDGINKEPCNIRHRLLSPMYPSDKYRPDRPGLRASPFICDTDNAANLENVLVVEGEVKSMIAYITLDSAKWQVMGIPGKKIFRDLIPKLRGRQVVVCLDPDALPEAEEMARSVSGRVMEIQYKIDDAINAGMIDKVMLRQLIRASRKIRS